MLKSRLAAASLLGVLFGAVTAAAGGSVAVAAAGSSAAASPRLASADSCAGQTTPTHASTGAASTLQLVGHTTSYVDFQRNTHLLGEVTNTGPTVEVAIAVLDLLDNSGAVASTARVYLPTGWLVKGEEAPFDYPVAPDTGFTGKWAVDHFEALPTQVMPSHKFLLANVTGPTGPGDQNLIHGEARNDNGYTVNLIKVIASFFGPCGIVYAEPTVVNSNTELIGPGGEYPFLLPRQTGTPADVDVNNRSLIVEANEPGAPYPLTDLGVLAAGGKVSTVKATIPKFIGIVSHTPKSDTTLDGVPNPTASDQASVLHPGTVVPRHDKAPANTGSDAAQALVGVDRTPPGPRTSAAYAPLLLIVLIGAFALLTTLRNATVGLAAFQSKRRARRETLSKLAPGATGGYGAMPGAQR